MIELKIEDASTCYICGSPEKIFSTSLHIWEIEYACGCKITGAMGYSEIYLDKKCPDDNAEEKDINIT